MIAMPRGAAPPARPYSPPRAIRGVASELKACGNEEHQPLMPPTCHSGIASADEALIQEACRLLRIRARGTTRVEMITRKLSALDVQLGVALLERWDDSTVPRINERLRPDPALFLHESASLRFLFAQGFLINLREIVGQHPRLIANAHRPEMRTVLDVGFDHLPPLSSTKLPVGESYALVAEAVRFGRRFRLSEAIGLMRRFKRARGMLRRLETPRDWFEKLRHGDVVDGILKSLRLERIPAEGVMSMHVQVVQAGSHVDVCEALGFRCVTSTSVRGRRVLAPSASRRRQALLRLVLREREKFFRSGLYLGASWRADFPLDLYPASLEARR